MCILRPSTAVNSSVFKSDLSTELEHAISAILDCFWTRCKDTLYLDVISLMMFYGSWIVKQMASLSLSPFEIYMHAVPALQWRHNEHDIVSNHQPHDCLLNRLFGRRSKKTSKLRVAGLCAGNSPGTGEFPAQKASNAENVSIWWRHHATKLLYDTTLVLNIIFSIFIHWGRHKNYQHFADNLLKVFFSNSNHCVLIKIYPNFVP